MCGVQQTGDVLNKRGGAVARDPPAEQEWFTSGTVHEGCIGRRQPHDLKPFLAAAWRQPDTAHQNLHKRFSRKVAVEQRSGHLREGDATTLQADRWPAGKMAHAIQSDEPQPCMEPFRHICILTLRQSE